MPWTYNDVSISGIPAQATTVLACCFKTIDSAVQYFDRLYNYTVTGTWPYQRRVYFMYGRGYMPWTSNDNCIYIHTHCTSNNCIRLWLKNYFQYCIIFALKILYKYMISGLAISAHNWSVCPRQACATTACSECGR